VNILLIPFEEDESNKSWTKMNKNECKWNEH